MNCQVYRIDVETPHGSWTVFHRYSDFRAMHAQISAWAVPAGAKLPGRSSNRDRVTNSQYYVFLASRRLLLDGYLQALLDIPRASTHLAVLQFLGVNDNLLVSTTRPSHTHPGQVTTHPSSSLPRTPPLLSPCLVFIGPASAHESAVPKRRKRRPLATWMRRPRESGRASLGAGRSTSSL